MKAILRRYAERFDAASLRERVMMFVALALVLVFAANAAFIDPLRARQKRLATDIAQKQAELAALRASLQGFAQKGDPDAPLRARQAALRTELTNLNTRIAQEQRRFTAPDRMRAGLEEMLRSNPRLALVDLRTLPAVPLAEGRAGAGGPALYRHGIELSVSGGYAELYEYLRTLEKLPTQLYWGRAELTVNEYPTATLKLTLYTVSFDRAWLVV